MGNSTYAQARKMGRVPDAVATPPADHRPMTDNLTLAGMIASARDAVREIPPAEACEALNSGAIALILDVREPQEFSDGHVPDAVNIPRGLLEIRADPASPSADTTLSAERSGRILVYCTKGPGARSLLAAQTLASMGYQRVEVLEGGLIAWEAAGLPAEHAQEAQTT
jgi:rhodanese-related sulfurtransferase